MAPYPSPTETNALILRIRQDAGAVLPILAKAAAVAAAAPARRAEFVYSALIPWHLVAELRDALDAAGIEWRRRP